MNLKELERYARRSGKTEREVCLQKIAHYKDMLQEVSDDYRGLDQASFDEQIEEEIDSYREE